MHNVFDYLLWRGDLTFLESPLNEVDNLIFCAMTYVRLDELLYYQEKISIKDLYLKYQKKEPNTVFKQSQNRLFKMISESNRFKNVIITHYFNEVDKEQEMQIGGMTFVLPNDTIFIAFKGTDGTLTGWKEDFNLSFKTIPSQKRAVQYLEEILSHTKKKVFVAGHSKGGNLAMYASIFCKESENIVQIYNNDGPGFTKEIIGSNNYLQRKEKIITFIPKASIVGNLLNQDTKTIIVKSKQIGILQHDLYSWEVSNNHFVYSSELSEETKKLCNTLNELIEKIPKDEKEKIISFLYEIFESENIQDIEKALHDVFLSKVLLQKYHLKIEYFSFLWKIFPLIVEILKNI